MLRLRLREAAFQTFRVYSEYPVRVVFVTVLLDAVASAVLVGTVSQSALSVIGGILAGTALVIVVVFFWAFFSFYRRGMAYRIAELEGEIEALTTRMNVFIDEKYGDVDQFVPVYHDLRAALGDAIRKVEGAQETGRLWGWTDSFEEGVWKKNRGKLATHPWAKADRVYGPLSEAFQQIDRLRTLRSLRFRNPRVKPTDDLDAALASFYSADEVLRQAIQTAEGADPDQLFLDEDEG